MQKDPPPLDPLLDPFLDPFLSLLDPLIDPLLYPFLLFCKLTMSFRGGVGGIGKSIWVDMEGSKMAKIGRRHLWMAPRKKCTFF